ncbi:MAG: ribosome biogenesis GTPase YlqF, partial [Lachnospiraceae bacterium]|nr:ribosome biogenesis GTPase YlqF [Lachnospiraceae bacterium]
MGDNPGRNTINWYPGHMNKARIMMEESMRLVDLCVEIVDARAPLSSRNPDIDRMAKGKGRVIILNKSDLADKAVNSLWTSYFTGLGFQVCLTDSKNKSGLKEVNSA